MKTFTPTYLYIKRHSITGKLYFGKTIQNPETCIGSGTRWSNHANYYGKQYIETLWYTNGEHTTLFSEGTAPDGWVRGRKIK